MSWFKRHLNWTWLLMVVIVFNTVWFSSPIPYVIAILSYYAVSMWVLHRKGRGNGWVIVPVFIPFLKNKRQDIVNG